MDEAAQVTKQEPQFTQQWAGERASAPQPLWSLLQANKDDADLCEWLSRARVGDDLTTGGGAAPRCTVRRVA
jgi:hypothetical protein